MLEEAERASLEEAMLADKKRETAEELEESQRTIEARVAAESLADYAAWMSTNQDLELHRAPFSLSLGGSSPFASPLCVGLAAERDHRTSSENEVQPPHLKGNMSIFPFRHLFSIDLDSLA